jgi:hypothetical protein
MTMLWICWNNDVVAFAGMMIRGVRLDGSVVVFVWCRGHSRNDLSRVVPAKAGTQQIREHIEVHGFRLSPE